jgi:hypothetical protein
MNTSESIQNGTSGAGRGFSIIAERAEEAIAVLDANGMVRYANAAWVRMHGREQPSAFHNKEQMRGDVLPFLREIGRRGQISGPVGHLHSSGAVVPTNTTMAALRDKGGELRGVIVFATDTSQTEQLQKDVRGLERELEKRAAEMKSAVERLEEQSRQQEMIEDLLKSRGVELSSVNKRLWQYLSEREEAQEQLRVLNVALSDKDKEATDLKSRLQRQSAEQVRMEQQMRAQHRELTGAIRQLHDEVIAMKHREVEFLEDVEVKPETAGPRGGLDPAQLKELSDMAKKFAAE